MRVMICCEGMECNNGLSAEAREAALVLQLPRATDEMRDESTKHARSMVSRALAVTEHARVGVGRQGYTMFACAECGHERIYGSTMLVGAGMSSRDW